MRECAINISNVWLSATASKSWIKTHRRGSERCVLSDVSVVLDKGNVFGVVGPNGAGKQQLLKLIAGELQPQKGSIDFFGGTRMMLSAHTCISSRMTGRRFLRTGEYKCSPAVAEGIIDYSGVSDIIDTPMTFWSQGMRARLLLSIAVFTCPQLLVIEDVLDAVDPAFCQKFCEFIRKHIQDDPDFTCVLASHDISKLKMFCDKVIWLENGTVRMQGNAMDVLNAYHNVQYLCAKGITVSDKCLQLDLSQYILPMYEAGLRWCCGKPYDAVHTYCVGNNSVKVTRRILENDDLFVYFEIDPRDAFNVELTLDTILKKTSNDTLYQKPPFDNRYGENKVTGWNGYYNLKCGSAIATKVYYYNEKIETYEGDHQSKLFHLVEESNEIHLDSSSQKLLVQVQPKAERAVFTVLLSRAKLFCGEENLTHFEEYHYRGVFNNDVWCTFFMSPSGSYTKLPYSIEPFTREGYGFSLHHSSRKDLFIFYQQTKERFYFDMMKNAVLQAYMYQKNESYVFFTPFTSTWLKKDTGITAPYIDTRLNETFAHMMEDFLPDCELGQVIDPIKNYLDFLYAKFEEGKQVYRAGDGVFFPDYFKDGLKQMTHASLNHQLGTATLFYQGYKKYGDAKYLTVFDAVIEFIENTHECWVKEDSGDLYYGVKISDGVMSYYGNDYVYVTVMDLLYVQQEYMDLKGCENNVLKALTRQKAKYLEGTKYNIYDENAAPAPGEGVGVRKQVLKMLEKVYGQSGIL